MTTATILPLATRHALPSCPDWCAGDCIGGEPETLGSRQTISDRLHERDLAKLKLGHGDSTRLIDRVDLRLMVERIDSVEPEVPATVTQVKMELTQASLTGFPSRAFVRLDAADLRFLALRLAQAADLLDAAEQTEVMV